MHTPKVSVIIPTYNRAYLLPRAIESVLSQDVDNLELLIVDDGSTDNTNEIVEGFMKKDQRIIYHKLPENRGLGFVRDLGLYLATGEYVAWLDSDDEWLPGKLETQLRIMHDHPEIDILFGDYLNVISQDRKESAFASKESAVSMLRTKEYGNGLFIVEGGVENAIMEFNFITIPTSIFHKNLIEKTGGFDVMLHQSVDFEFFARASILGAKFAYVNSPLMNRFKDSASITAQSKRSYFNALEAHRRIDYFLENLGRTDLTKCIRKAQHKNVQKLLQLYGNEYKLIKAIKTYVGSLQYGLSFHTLIYLLVSLSGPPGINLFNSIQTRRRTTNNS